MRLNTLFKQELNPLVIRRDTYVKYVCVVLRYVVEDGHAMTGEDNDDGEFEKMNAVVPGDWEEEVCFYFLDDIGDSLEFKEDEHFCDLKD